MKTVKIIGSVYTGPEFKIGHNLALEAPVGMYKL